MSTPNTQSVARLLDALNPEQRRAVEHRGGPLLLLAGAGSGKTRVITVRIAYLVDQGLPPRNVLALTFTNKAAGEMAERVAGLVGADAAKDLTVGTFHSLGLRMLDEDGRHLGIPKRFTILDAADQASALRRCLKEMRLDPKRHDPRVFLTAISNARNAGLSPEDVEAQPGRRTTARVYAAYLDHLRTLGALDFDDLILLPVQLLREVPEVLAKWRARFRTVLVDEYQDTNMMQLELVRMLVDEHRSLCVVGDDDQSIYGWRGACVDNILQFERHFPDATTIALTQNYRSTGHILAAANAVIEQNRARTEKSLWTDVGEGEPVRVVACNDDRSEADFIAHEIRRRRDLESRPWSHFGVLFRVGAQSERIEQALRNDEIPYRVVGAFDFYERKEVKDLLAYMRLVENPRDRASFLRVANFPQRGVGPQTLRALMTYAGQRNLTLFDALTRASDIPGLDARAAAGLTGFRAILDDSRAAHRREGDVAALATWLVYKGRLREAWLRDPTEGPGGQGRQATIERLLENIRGLQERKPDLDLTGWLRRVALEGRRDRDEEGKDAVALMTLHSAKGLEWPVCFVIGCIEGIIPHQRTLDSFDVDLSEERRLFYVGLTRARRHAYLTWIRNRSKYKGSEPARASRFLRDIPADHRDDLDRAESTPVDRSDARARFAELRARLDAAGGGKGGGT